MADDTEGRDVTNSDRIPTTAPERREVNHRIANSLQIVGAFLRAKRNYDRDTAETVLNNAADRIAAIAHFHRYLAQHDAFAVVSLLEFLRSSMSDMCASAGLNCDISGDDIRLPSSKALSLLIVINEMAINASKHAYDHAGDGKFSILCKKRGDELVISVADAGKGLPAGFSLSDSRGFGTEIIKSTVEQLGGALDFENLERGCIFHIRIPSS